MQLPNYSSNYSVATGTSNVQVSVPVINKRNPEPSDINFALGRRWINRANNSVWTLLNVTTDHQGTSSATWKYLGNTIENLAKFIVDAGSSPVLPNGMDAVTVVGPLNENISTTGVSLPEAVINFSLIQSPVANLVNILAPGGSIYIQDKSTTTSFAGKAAPTVAGVTSVMCGFVTSSSLIFLSSRGFPFNITPGLGFQISAGTPAPSSPVIFSYLIINSS